FYADLGMLCLRTRQLDDALHALRKAVELNPANPFAHGNIGLAHLQKGDVPAARHHLQRAADLFGPDSPEGKTTRAKLAELE
ncbi:MAG: tetratricopeptide repeat protein, partial [Planctomycetes bacterium]|nr:tetratricopeptide repeat protein [Planctomycetota bacterium]